MSEFKIQMPKLGESVQEATITKWFVKEGDRIEEDESLFEVATDKVDSEIPSPVEGTIKKIHYPVNSLVPVGEIVAVITTADDDQPEQESEAKKDKEPATPIAQEDKVTVNNDQAVKSPEIAVSMLLRQLPKQNPQGFIRPW